MGQRDDSIEVGLSAGGQLVPARRGLLDGHLLRDRGRCAAAGAAGDRVWRRSRAPGRDFSGEHATRFPDAAGGHESFSGFLSVRQADGRSRPLNYSDVVRAAHWRAVDHLYSAAHHHAAALVQVKGGRNQWVATIGVNGWWRAGWGFSTYAFRRFTGPAAWPGGTNGPAFQRRFQ